MKKSLWNTIKNGCSIFTLITVISYTIGMILSTNDKAYIPSLKSIYIYLAFSILFCFANRLLLNKKINVWVRLLIHCIITGILFFCVIVLGGGFSGSGFATLIIMSVYVASYLIFAVIYSMISKKKEHKENINKQYTSVFR